jgi:hypothetical protein
MTALRAACIPALILLLGAVLVGADQTVEFQGHPDRSDPRAKIASALRPWIDQAPPAGALDPRLRALTVPAATTDRITVRLDCPAGAADLAAIIATGATVVASSARWHAVTVAATPAQITALSRLATVARVAPAWRPIHHGQPGTYNDPADGVIHTDTLRTDYGVTGSGRILGIISDSINATSTVGSGTTSGANPGTLTNTTPQISGNLPADILFCNLGLGNTGNTDEGEAMMEEAYHLVPGATFAFSSCGQSQTDMATSITDLAAQAHCNLICDDVGFPDEPMFQDGPIAQAADTFHAGGGIYLSAAGNAANSGLGAVYTPVSTTPDPHTNGVPDGNAFHNWGIGGATPGFLPITITGSQPFVTIVLQWNQPYASYGLGAGSQADYDLYLFRSPSISSRNLIADSIDSQGTIGAPAGDPLEIIQWQSPYTGSRTVYLAVDRFQGLATVDFRIAILAEGATVTSTSGLLNGATIYGHPAAAGALAIAAAYYGTPTTVESFTSFGGWGSGGLPFWFDDAGNALSGAPVLRNKPDLTAPDGVSVSNANFAPFYGTSGATPHATAAAALVWAAHPDLTNDQVIAQLEANATDITTSPAGSGADGWSGYGMVNALAAAEAAGSPGTTTGSTGSTAGSTGTSTGTTTGTTTTGTTVGGGSTGGGFGTSSVTVDITGLATTAAHGTYATGTIPIQVAFSAPVTVTGSPTITLDTAPAESAVYTSGSGSDTLTFTYTIQAGDHAAALDVASTTALSGGAITSTTGTVSTALPTPGATGSLSANTAITIAAATVATTVVGSPSVSTSPAFTFAVTFSQPVTGFTAPDVVVVGGTVGTISGSGADYAVPVVATNSGTVSLIVLPDVVTDSQGDGNASAQGDVTYDEPMTATTPMPATFAATVVGSPALSNQSGFTFAVTFAQPVTSFVAADLAVVGGTVGTITGSGATFAVPVTATHAGTVSLIVLPGVVSDSNGDSNATAEGDVTYDPIAPTVVLSASPATIAVGGFSTVSFVFSEGVFGLAVGTSATAVTVTGGTAGSVVGTPGGTIYSMPVTATVAGTITVTVPAGAVVDRAGNALAGPATVEITVAPDGTVQPIDVASTPAVGGSSGSKCGLGSIALLSPWALLLWWRLRRTRRR